MYDFKACLDEPPRSAKATIASVIRSVGNKVIHKQTHSFMILFWGLVTINYNNEGIGKFLFPSTFNQICCMQQ